MLRVGTTDKKEYRLWLTRRFIVVLWPALGGQLEKATQLAGADPKVNPPAAPTAQQQDRLAQQPKHVKQAVLGMEHQEAIDTSDFSKKHADDNTDLTANSGPLLVEGAKVQPWDGKKLVVTLQTREKQDITLTLDKRLLHAFCHLVTQASDKADWGLTLSIGEPIATTSPAQRTVLH